MMNGRLSNQESKQNFNRNYEELKNIPTSSYPLENIESISQKYHITSKDLIVNLFGKDAIAYERLKRGEINRINYDGIVIEYKSPECPKLELLSTEDLEDSVLFTQTEFSSFFENVTNKDNLMDAIKLFQQNKFKKNQDLQTKYDDMYLKLLNKYKDDIILNSETFNVRKQYYSNYQQQYFQQLYEVLKRNPKYTKGIEKETFEKIASDFNIPVEELYSKMFKKNAYLYKHKNRINLHDRTVINMPVHVREVLANDIVRISNNISKLYDFDKVNKEDIAGEIIYSLLNYGGMIIYNFEEGKNLDDLIGMMGGYAKRVSRCLASIIQTNRNMLRGKK